MKGSSILRISGIAMVLYAVLLIVLDIVGVVRTAGVLGGIGNLLAEYAVIVTVYLRSLLLSAFMLVTGLFGVMYWTAPKKYGVCLVLGILLLAANLLVFILSLAQGNFNPESILFSAIAIVLPGAYIAGALQLKSLG